MSKLLFAETQVQLLLLKNKLFRVNLHIAQKNDSLYLTVGSVYDTDKYELLIYIICTSLYFFDQILLKNTASGHV